MDPLHSATTGPSALGPAQIDFDPRLAAPFHLKIRKALTIYTNPDIHFLPGYRRESYRGNPVYVGTIRLAGFEACQRRFCVTGDTDDGDHVTLTIQDKTALSQPISDDEEILHKAMKKAQEFTQAGIMRILKIDQWLWTEMCTPISDIEVRVGERLDDDPSRVRDRSPSLFKRMISNHVVRSIKAARNREFEHFTKIFHEPDGLTEIYRRCGWTDLAEMNDTEMARQFMKSDRILATVKLPGLEW